MMTELPDPRTDLDEFVHECHARMIGALRRYTVIEEKLGKRFEELKLRHGAQVAPVEAGNDLEMRMLVDERHNARRRVQLYATAIQTEQVIDDMLRHGRIHDAKWVSHRADYASRR